MATGENITMIVAKARRIATTEEWVLELRLRAGCRV